MFKVIDKTTGEVFTVYGLNGMFFLVFHPEKRYWEYKFMPDCVPVEV